MITFHRFSLFVVLATFTIGLAACSKKNPELETDYATKKASAQTLMDQIDKSMATMKTDHDQWMTTLSQASAKPGADTAKINSLKSDIAKHESDMAAIGTLEDSTKLYMNATPDQGDAFKNADDRLGTNFNDLNDKWKSFQDAHTNLQQQVQQLAVNAAGTAADSMATKASQPAKPEAKKAPAEKKAAPAPAPEKHEHHGAPRNSAQ